MKRKVIKRAICVSLSALLAVSSLFTGITAAALDSQPPTGDQGIGKAQPHFSGYRVKDLQNWDKDTDPYADMLRARIPLQERNEPFQETQADPTLTDDAKVMLMQGDYGNSFFDSMIYNNDFTEHCFNFWQYTDLWCPWHGAATAYTPRSLEDLGFEAECGMINIPNPAYTNAAHKNGVLSIACMYFDQAFRPGQRIDEILKRDEDGNFLVVDKLVEMAEYYGYDGYFLNQEDATSEASGGDAALKELMSQLTERGLYTQYYTAHNSDVMSTGWLEDDQGKTICNSVFPDYGSWSRVDSSIEWCEENGYNIYDVGFFGSLCNLNSTPDRAFIPGSKNLKASIALFTPSDSYQRGLTFSSDVDRPAFQQARFQWMVTERERIFFSGAKQDPTDTDFEDGMDWSHVDAGVVKNHGVAEFISERSVIDGSTFYTNFNTGHGMQYFVDGQVSQDDEWAHIGIQDLLPSWQWWIDTEGTKLGADFDYGAKDVRADKNGGSVQMPYTQIGGYNGGSSLVVYGDLDSENFLHLYKTDLSVGKNSKLSITYNKPSETDGSAMEIGVIFKNDPNTVVTFHVPQANKQTDGWVTRQISLGDYAGEEIAAIGVNFDNGSGIIEDYQMNIGELKLLDGEDYTPDAPTGLSIRTAYNTKEMVLEWDLSEYDEVERYNIYADLSDGRRIYMGGVYDEVYYIKNTMAEEIVTMEVTAVGKDGSESKPATIQYNYRQNVGNLNVSEAKDANGLTMQAQSAGYLDVNWTNPTTEYKELKLDLKLVDTEEEKTYSTTVEKGVDSVRMYVPRGQGETYDLYVTTIYEDGSESEPIAYRGRLKDVWSQPIDKEDICFYSDGRVGFINPDSVDWFRIHVYVNGEKIYEGTRGESTINYGTQLPDGALSVDVVVEDYSGNLSEPVKVPVDRSSGSHVINEENVPDPVLRQAIIDQIGNNLEEVNGFTGTLDLSGMEIHDLTGLSLVFQASVIDLSNTPIESIKQGDLGGNVGKLILRDCDSLTKIYKDAFFNTGITEIDLTGCKALQIISLNNSDLEKIICEDAESFSEVVSVDLSGSRFDFSQGTPEQAFKDIMEQACTGKEDIKIPAFTTSNLATGATVIDTKNISQSNAEKLFNGQEDNLLINRIPAYVTFSLNEPQTIEQYKIYRASGDRQSFVMYYSEDGEEYTQMGEEANNIKGDYQQVLDEPITAQYFKLEIVRKNTSGDSLKLQEIELWGKDTIVYEAGVQSGSQRPRVVPAEMETTVQVEKQNGREIDLQEILTEAKQTAENNATSVRGNTVEELKDAAWLDPDYELAAEDQIDREVHVIKVTDRDGNVSYDTVLDQSVDNIYTVDYITYNSANVEGENLYTFTVNVKGVTSVLERVIEIAEQMVADGALDNTMEAVVAEFNAALQAAKDLVAQEYASQEDLNAAAVRLVKVMGKVDWKQGDKTVLEVAVDVANAINENLDQYEEAGKQEFIDALANAQTILASGNAWQEDVDAAYDALMEAMTNLRMTPNKDILNEMINEASGLDLSTYTEDSAAALNEALANAKAVAANENATQTEVDAAADTLEAAMSGLVLVNDDENQAAEGNTTGTDTTTPVGEGTTPTKTGDAGVAGLVMLAAISAAGLMITLKKRNK